MTPYEELETPADQRAGCEQVTLRLDRLADAARKVTDTPPSIHFDEFPREVRKRDIQISEAAQRLANALHLHLD